jgi:uncharacterized protein YheU (UPF0270 family)
MMSCPSAKTVPLVGFTIPQMMLMRVVLPAPFGPSSAKISPGRISRSTPFRALNPDAYVLVSRETLMIGCKASPGGASREMALLLRIDGLECAKLTSSEFPDEPKEAVIVPHTELAQDTLRSVVESFVLREGTDYGEREFSLEQKQAHVLRQLEHGEAQIVFDPETQTIDIILSRPASRAR